MTPQEISAAIPRFEAAVFKRAVASVAAGLAGGRSPAEWTQERLSFLEALEQQGNEAFATDPPDVSTLFELAEGRAPRPSERRALRGSGSRLDALRERWLARLGRVEAEVRVGAHVALATPSAELVQRLSRSRRWRVAVVGLEAFARLARPWPSALHDVALGLATSPEGPVWVQVAALEALAADAPALLVNRLAQPAASEDDFFVRRRVVRALGVQAPALLLGQLPVLQSDPSEAVRLEAVQHLVDASALASFAGDTSPRVRARVLQQQAQHAPTQFYAALATERDELPLRVAVEQLVALHTPQAITALRRLAGSAPTADLRRLCAEGLERMHHQVDPVARAAMTALEAAALKTPEGGAQALHSDQPADVLGRAMAVLSTSDFGLELEGRGDGAWRLRRGDVFGRRWWRVLHEVRSPSPDKRQGSLHTVGRVHPGEWRAPPGGLAEVTATKVPGERVQLPGQSDWGRALPMVDDFLARPASGRASLFSASGITRIDYPSGADWLRARLELTWRYEKWARRRLASLTGVESRERREYLEGLARLGFVVTFQPHGLVGDEISSLFPEPRAESAAVSVAALIPSAEVLRLLVDPSSNDVNQLAGVAVAALGLFVARLAGARQAIERARRAIPLSIGGWGTRGKSGTERIKAGLFQGLGAEVLVKTTGCEAMVIHAVPDQPASEVFIYRTYDKATIWEQRDVLELAERFGVDVFLWECMALNPGYVELLEQEWMRDDFCTLTNTYPDHENIQGPAGLDIPRVMTRFLPRGRPVFTAEEQMLPILREGARASGAQLESLDWKDAALLPADVLARFPYDEHPRNIALVVKLAAALGVPEDVALKEMADWVVPDLGVLKTYPEARWRGRRLTFSNGMSANERTGFLNNWRRCGFDRHHPDEKVGEWIVTVVNNRADRVSRSMVFADIVVEDASAHAQLLIGTNLEGLSGFIEESLSRVLGDFTLFHDDEAALPPEAQLELARERAARLLLHFKLGRLGAARLAHEAEAMARGAGGETMLPVSGFEPLLRGEASTLAAAKDTLDVTAWADWAAGFGEQAADAVAHLRKLTAMHACLLAFHAGLEAAVRSGQAAARKGVEAKFTSLVREWFRESIVPLWNPGLSGDQIVDQLARAAPPGFRVRVMGIQNIKGTGLDFAYRWVHFDRTVRTLRQIAKRGDDAAVRATALVESEGLGVLDFVLLKTELEALARDSAPPLAEALTRVAARAAERLTHGTTALSATGGSTRSGWVVALERIADVYDGIWRRWKAGRTMDALSSGRMSHDAAARQMQDLMKRQKGGWLFKRRGS